MIEAGQVNLWEYTGITHSVVEATPIGASVRDGGILVRVEDKQLLGLLLAQRPETADFEIGGWAMPDAEERLSTRDVPIRYKGGDH